MSEIYLTLKFPAKPTNPVFKDLTGNVVGLLTVLAYLGTTHKWLCQCECGNMASVHRDQLRDAKTQSCGCLFRKAVVKHGKSYTAEYNIWSNMRRRCQNPNNSKFADYGGRGIRVCQHWNSAFDNFLADVGLRPAPTLSLDRIDNDGNYSCGHCEECLEHGWVANCRWTTATVQMMNRRNSKMLTWKDKTQSLIAWSKDTGIERSIIDHRLRKGWSVEQALTVPVLTQPPPVLLTFNNETHSLATWSKKLNLSYSLLHARYTRGWSTEAILTTPRRSATEANARNFLTLDGRTFHLAEWSRQTGLSETTITNRLKRGWSVEKTLTTPPNLRHVSRDDPRKRVSSC